MVHESRRSEEMSGICNSYYGNQKDTYYGDHCKNRVVQRVKKGFKLKQKKTNLNHTNNLKRIILKKNMYFKILLSTL